MQQDTYHKGFRLEARAGNMDYAPDLGFHQANSFRVISRYEPSKSHRE